LKANPYIRQVLRTLRKDQTAEEKLLWQNLRNKQLNGFKFIRQYPVMFGSHSDTNMFYVIDFYCAEAKLGIELDGKIHLKTKEYDKKRDAMIRDSGITLIRIKNEELNELGRVIDIIRSYLG
jgi:very-short-patch-repair endonuclease